jgi:hypothetical protein
MSAFDKKAAMAAMTAGINSVTNVLTMANNQFTVKTGKESKRVTTHDKDLGANCVDMIIVAANPNTTQVFYKDVYKAGSNEAPTCYSDNGVGPSSQAAAPQALLCASCPRNVWGANGTECKPSKKICCIVPSFSATELCLFRVPTASRRNFKACIDGIPNVTAADGTPAYTADVVVRMYFEPDELNILNFVVLDALEEGDESRIAAYDALGGNAPAVALTGSNDAPITHERFKALMAQAEVGPMGNEVAQPKGKQAQRQLPPTHRVVQDADEITEVEDAPDDLTEEDRAFLAGRSHVEAAKAAAPKRAPSRK